MAFENIPETEKSSLNKSEAQTKNTNPVRALILILLIVALVGTWGYLLWDKSKTNETISQKENLITTTSTQRDELQKELADATMRYDLLKTNNAQKDSTISAKDQEITEKAKRIQELLTKSNASIKELKEAKALIASLNTDIEGYKKQIEILENQKTQLTEEKNVVTTERDRVIKGFDSAKVIIQQRDELIDIASTLHASNFNIIGINERNNGKEKVTEKAKKVDKLRVSFDLDENMISPSGNKEVFIIIKGPDNNIISEQAMGSGSFYTREGEQKTFTQKLDVNYTKNQRQTVSFDWKQEKNFETGIYTIEVYNNGFKVGEGIRPLRKG